MRFHPPKCPYPHCSSRSRKSLRFRHRGSYRRACDGRTVLRFECLDCRRSFSTQTFRLDYRLRRPTLWVEVFEQLISKVTLRQIARIHHCSRKSIAQRLTLFGLQARAFHLRTLEEARARFALTGRFQLDELETYEEDRRLSPLTVPVLIERTSFFVLGADVAPLASRGGLSPFHRLKKERREELLGKRRSGSRKAVAGMFELLARFTPRSGPLLLESDEKASYRTEARKVFGKRLVHQCYASKSSKRPSSKLFPINHTLAQMRDGVSRLVRRTWASSKRAGMLSLHIWIWIGWRNYVRGITNYATKTTPAMALQVLPYQVAIRELIAACEFELED